VLVDWTGGVKIADFGIAKVLGMATAGTRVGIVKGTLGCMAPEQARGEQVDERADVYAAALLAWRLATGRVPFAKQQGDEFELLRAMRNPRIKPLAVLRPDLPEPLLDAVGRALEPEREMRTITAAEFAAVVSENVDVRAGWLELATLLENGKNALERSVKRAPGGEHTHSSGARVESTLRYEEVALAFDEEPAPEGPTFEAHALPSDPRALAALPLAQVEESVDASSPPPPVAAAQDPEAPRVQPQPPLPESPPSRRPQAWGPILAVILILVVGLGVALLASAR
jgi:serine/threonine-protein kinase